MVYKLIFSVTILFCQGTETFHLSFDFLNDDQDIFMYRYEDGSVKFTIDSEASFLYNPDLHDSVVRLNSDASLQNVRSYDDFKLKCLEVVAQDYTEKAIKIRPYKDYFEKIFLYKKEGSQIMRYEVDWLETSLD